MDRLKRLLKEAMDIIAPARSDKVHALAAIRNEYGGVNLGKPLWTKYLTYSEGGSNKFHYFAVFDTGGGGTERFVAANAHGRIGYTKPQVTRITDPTTKELAVKAAEAKVLAKTKKGYAVAELPEGLQEGRSWIAKRKTTWPDGTVQEDENLAWEDEAAKTEGVARLKQVLNFELFETQPLTLTPGAKVLWSTVFTIGKQKYQAYVSVEHDKIIKFGAVIDKFGTDETAFGDTFFSQSAAMKAVKDEIQGMKDLERTL